MAGSLPGPQLRPRNLVITIACLGNASFTDNPNLSLKVIGISWPGVVAKPAIEVLARTLQSPVKLEGDELMARTASGLCSITYPSGERDLYDPVVERMEDNFRPGKGCSVPG
jgi:hypothetical protein